MKTRSLRVLLAAGAIAVPAFASPAQAADVGVVVGTGTITPGVPLPPSCVTGSSVAFDGTGVIATPGLPAGPYAVSFRGKSNTCESILSGSGTGTLSGGVSGSVIYTRTTGIIELAGTVTVAGQSRSLAATCTVEPTSANPVITYAVECAVTLT